MGLIKPVVFVSSIMDGFKSFREAAREAIVSSEGIPLLIEDYPSQPSSARSACLDGVKNSDIFIVIIANRGGWLAPSGKLVIEEEYEEARKRKLPILVFMEEGKKDEQAEDFSKKVSDYVSGKFRTTFNDEPQLNKAVKEAVKPIIQKFGRPIVSSSTIDEKLEKPYKIYNETSLRFVLCPERDEEIIDPVLMESDDFKNLILEIGHSRGVELFSYEQGKATEVEVESFIILQGEDGGGRGKTDLVRLEIGCNGLITIDTNVTGRVTAENAHQYLEHMVILEDDIKFCLRRCFLFAKVFYQSEDKYNRHDRMFCNVVLSDAGYRQLVKNKPRGNSIGMSMRDNEPVRAFDKAKLISRHDLEFPEHEIESIVTFLRRRLKE